MLKLFVDPLGEFTYQREILIVQMFCLFVCFEDIY